MNVKEQANKSKISLLQWPSVGFVLLLTSIVGSSSGCQQHLDGERRERSVSLTFAPRLLTPRLRGLSASFFSPSVLLLHASDEEDSRRFITSQPPPPPSVKNISANNGADTSPRALRSLLRGRLIIYEFTNDSRRWHYFQQLQNICGVTRCQRRGV